MPYTKDPHSLDGCETGFDIADVLEERLTIEIVESKTNEWRVRLRCPIIGAAVVGRNSLPGEWEIGQINLRDGSDFAGAEIDLVDVSHLPD